MRKIIIVLLAIFLVACSNEENKWPHNDIIEYTKGQIISIENNNEYSEIIIDNTTQSEYNSYIDALKAITYTEYKNNNNILTNGNKYIIFEYDDNALYDLNIKIYNQKPSNLD